MDIAKDAKTLSIIDEKVQLIKLSVGLAVVTIILFILPFPVFIPLLFVVLGATFLGLSFMKLERLKNLNTKIPKEPTKQTPTIDVQIHPDEKILAATYGIISKQTTGTSYLGLGKSSHPENTMMISNGHILIVLVPLGGDGAIVNGLYISTTNSLLNKTKIKELGEQLIKEKSVQEIALSNNNNITIAFTDIFQVTIKLGFNRGIHIKTKNNKKYSYSIQNKDELTKIKDILTYYKLIN